MARDKWKYKRLCYVCKKDTTPKDSFGVIRNNKHERIHYECEDKEFPRRTYYAETVKVDDD